MTRINANINPADLIDQHLIAEYREIIRIPNTILKKGFNSNREYPKEFRLGPGHVLYFYDKIKFLHIRFLNIKTEMDRRNIVNNIDDIMFIDMYENYPNLYNDINNSELDNGNRIIMKRIIDSMISMKRQPTINNKAITVQEYYNRVSVRHQYQSIQE